MKCLIATLLTVTIGLLATKVNSKSVNANGEGQPQYCVPEAGSHFSYDPKSREGPKFWGNIASCCDGHRQSPRNLISESSSSDCGVALPQFAYQGQGAVHGELYNSGHAPTVDLNGGTNAILTGAPYSEDSYVLANLHIHFRDLNGHGSEHAIDSTFYHGELHMVHFNSKYGDVGTALTQGDGLLVIGIMLEVVEEAQDNEVTRLIGKIADIEGIGKENSVSVNVKPTQLLPDSGNYFTYAGSLTTPPCSESVRWIVMQESRKINAEQVNILTSLRDEEGDLISKFSNDRPLQQSVTGVETNFEC